MIYFVDVLSLEMGNIKRRNKQLLKASMIAKNKRDAAAIAVEKVEKVNPAQKLPIVSK